MLEAALKDGGWKPDKRELYGLPVFENVIKAINQNYNKLGRALSIVKPVVVSITSTYSYM